MKKTLLTGLIAVALFAGATLTAQAWGGWGGGWGSGWDGCNGWYLYPGQQCGYSAPSYSYYPVYDYGYSMPASAAYSYSSSGYGYMPMWQPAYQAPPQQNWYYEEYWWGNDYYWW